jgi:hypothetical protein
VDNCQQAAAIDGGRGIEQCHSAVNFALLVIDFVDRPKTIRHQVAWLNLNPFHLRVAIQYFQELGIKVEMNF